MNYFNRLYHRQTDLDAVELLEIVPAKEPTQLQTASPNEQFDTGQTTRMLSAAGLVASWILGIVCVIVGSGAVTKPTTSAASSALDGPFHDWPELGISSLVAELLPLLFSFIITALNEAMGLIHATTLRWALGDRLVFNSNLRLFTSVRHRFCFSIASNTLYTALIILSYAAASLVFAVSPSETFCNSFDDSLAYEKERGCGEFVTLAVPAVCCLGVGLLGQACLATWQMLSVRVPTWSSNPLDTAWASVALGLGTRVPGRCMMSVHEGELPPAPQWPNGRQRSIWRVSKDARKIICYIWTLTMLSYVWFGVTQGVLVLKATNQAPDQHCNGCNNYLGSSWNLLPDRGKEPTSAAVIVEFTSRFYGRMFVLVCVFQGFLTLALYCAELITTLYRDERTWRQCYTQYPYKPRPNVLFRAATSWVAVTLFVLKAVLHWLFGKGMSYAYNWGIFLRPPQLLYLSIGATGLAALVTFLSFSSAKGEQPATFGHVQTLVDLVDEWHLLLFWGDKGVAIEGLEIRHAGTASVPLSPIVKDAQYEGDLLYGSTAHNKTKTKTH